MSSITVLRVDCLDGSSVAQNLLDGNLRGHNVQAVLRHHDVAALALEYGLDGGRVLRVGFHQKLLRLAYTDAALLIEAVLEIV